jgi:hypothetical protein
MPVGRASALPGHTGAAARVLPPAVPPRRGSRMVLSEA